MTIRTIRRSRFFKPIYKRAGRARHVQSVMFELTYRCNFRCPHCYVKGSSKAPKELTTRQVFNILDQLKAMGVWSVAFTGGEALLRKDIFDILAYAKQSGFLTTLLSNGYLIDARAARRLAEVSVHNVDITLNSLTPQVFDRLTGVKRSLKKVRKAIDLLIMNGIPTKIKSTAMIGNRDELVRIGKLARKLNIIYNLDTEILPCRDRSSLAVEQWSLSPEEADRIHREVYPEMFSGKGRKTRPRRKRDKMFNCGVGRSSFSITPYGKMNFCLEIDHPEHNILKYGVAGCWEKIKREVDRLNDTPGFVCKACDLSNYCGWCPGRSYIESGSFNRCSEYFKKQALRAKTRRRAHGRKSGH